LLAVTLSFAFSGLILFECKTFSVVTVPEFTLSVGYGRFFVEKATVMVLVLAF